MDPKDRLDRARVFAAGAGVLSLTMDWIAGGKLQQLPLLGIQLQMDGIDAWNGSVDLLVRTPLWFVVLVSIVANVLPAVRVARGTPMESRNEWLISIVSAVWVSYPIVSALGSNIEGLMLGFGAVCGATCALTPIVCLVAEHRRAAARGRLRKPRISSI